MDQLIFDKVNNIIPDFNPELANGIACSQVDGIVSYFDGLMHCIAEEFPTDVVYHGMRRCTPEEEFNFAMGKKPVAGNGEENGRYKKLTYEISKNDLFMVVSTFSKVYEDGTSVLLPPRPMYLPFCRDGATLHLMSVLYHLSPIVADKSISATVNSIFLPLYRARINLYRVTHHFILDGQRLIVPVIWGNIYNKADRKKVRIETASMLYLLSKYGLKEAFHRFAKCAIVSGSSSEITMEHYPRNDWVIVQGTGLKPPGLKTKFYLASGLRVAIPRSQWNAMAETMCGALFYIADHYPERIDFEYLDDVFIWRVILGYTIFGESVGEGKLLNDIAVHIESVDRYVDAISRDWLATDNIIVNDCYELLAYLMLNYPQRVAEATAVAPSLYGKQLVVSRYLMTGIITNCFKMMYALKRSAAKKKLEPGDIDSILRKHLPMRAIIGINRKSGEVTTLANPGDSKVFKQVISSVLQTSTGAQSGKQVPFNSSLILDASIAEAGSYNHLPKTEPTGRSSRNLYTKLSKDFVIQRNPDLDEIITRTQKCIKMKLD